ncbi:hypothetical protein AB0E81_19335 [Streptomyces sp. NPDC033538]|uniref:hypothetical protein n=1 Tax=Streptomyces sp. NPDC033538 TaxID=3155367 RepID=UPI0033FA371C
MFTLRAEGGQSIAGLVRDHHVSRGTIRTAVADLMPEHIDDRQDTPASRRRRVMHGIVRPVLRDPSRREHSIV